MSLFNLVTEYFDRREIKYNVLEEMQDQQVIRVGFQAENKETFEVLLFFDDEDDSNVAFRIFRYCSFQESKLEKIYEICSQVNREYRWVKFFVDEEDCTVSVSDDVEFYNIDDGEKVLDVVFRMLHIADDAYPKFMKAIWA